MLNPTTLVERLLATGIASPEEIVGCSEPEILQLERDIGLHLPAAYRDFLRIAGHGAGRLWRDVDFRYESLLHINAYVRDLLSELEERPLHLPDRAFVLSMRRGEQFMFFVAEPQNPDPPIFYYFLGRDGFTRIADSLWAVLETELTELARIKDSLPPLFPWLS